MEFVAHATGLAGLILLLLGVGLLLSTVLVIGPMHQPQALILGIASCSVILAVGAVLFAYRAAVLRTRQEVIEAGVASTGTITGVGEYVWAKVNHRRPWLVLYRYEVGGTGYEGRETMWDLPEGCAMGAQVAVLYDSRDPRRSALRR